VTKINGSFVPLPKSDAYEGLYVRSGRRCQRCFAGWANATLTILIVICAVALLGYLTVEYKFSVPMNEHQVVVQKIGLSHLQMLGVLGIYRAKGTRMFNEVMRRPTEVVGGSLSSLLPLRCLLGGEVWGPFFFTLACPLIFVLVASAIIFPASFCKKHIYRLRRGKTAPLYEGRCGIPRALACFKVLRKPMTREDIRAWGAPYRASSRIAGVVVFILFSMYVLLSLFRSLCSEVPTLTTTLLPLRSSGTLDS